MKRNWLPKTNAFSFPAWGELLSTFTHDLSGVSGANREQNERCQINASNDYESLQCWLNEYRHKATTYRTYQKESERFLLWAIIERQKPLSSLNRDDVEAYMDFLSNPQPKEKWCANYGGRGCKRGDPAWRPFTVPMTSACSAWYRTGAALRCSLVR